MIPENEFAPLQEVVDWILENGGVPYIAHTYWSGLRTDQWEDCEGLLGIEVWNSGCELEVGRGDSSLPLGRGARARPAAASRSRPTTRTTRASTAASPGRGCARAEKIAGGGARRAPHRRVLRLDRPDDPRRRRDDDAVTVRCSPAASVTLYSGRARGAARERGPARVPERRGGARAHRRRPDHLRPARAAVAPAVRRGSRSRRRGRRAWTNPLWIETPRSSG